jgi:hypothetical protein
MVPYRKLVGAMVDTLARIPDLEPVLAPADPVRGSPIVGYVDETPLLNSVAKAIYQMQPGTLLVNWIETHLLEGVMMKWSHIIDIYVRALPDQSNMDLVEVIMAGVPVPGDGMVWRNCPIMSGMLPTNVTNITRRTDTEGVDYFVIVTETSETGDWPL